jgi:flavin prenyltransferase
MAGPGPGSGSRRVVVAITGASGSAYGVRLLQHLRLLPEVEVHLVVSRSGSLTLSQETCLSPADLKEMADVTHRVTDVGASIASGSFGVHAMVVAPCSIRTLSAVAYCQSSDLISRAADVTLKEGRQLVLMVRETPLHLGHLRAMTAAAEAGAVIMPPVPALYEHPASVGELIDNTVRRVIERIGLTGTADVWQGIQPVSALGRTTSPSQPCQGIEER